MKQNVASPRRRNDGREAARPGGRIHVYVYGVARNGALAAPAPTGVPGGRPVRWLPAGPLAVLLSDAPDARARPDRRGLAAHERTLRAALEETSVLPFAFGAIARDEAQVREFLVRERGALLAALERTQGAREFRVSAAWAVADIFAYILSRDPRLRALRDRAFGGGRRPGREEMIDLGAAFEASRDRRREEDAEVARTALAPRCREIQDLGAKGEKGALDLACLVAREREAAFSGALADLAARLDERFTVNVTGPLPPYDFVDLRLSLDGGRG